MIRDKLCGKESYAMHLQIIYMFILAGILFVRQNQTIEHTDLLFEFDIYLFHLIA